jgi:hypothetical protein
MTDFNIADDLTEHTLFTEQQHRIAHVRSL